MIRALRLLFAVSLLAGANAAHALTKYAGFDLRQLDPAPLVVDIQGERRSEKVPVWVLFPAPTTRASDLSVKALLSASVDAPDVPNLPRMLGDGYRLRMLIETTQQPVDLSNGQLVSLQLPVFAYVPIDDAIVASRVSPTLVQPRAEVDRIAAGSEPITVATPALPGESPQVRTFRGEVDPSVSLSNVPTLPAARSTLAEIAQKAEAAADDGVINQQSVTEAGDIITSLADIYRKSTPVRFAFDEQPLSAALKALAREARVSYDIADDLPKRTVTASYVMSPFAAMEKIALHHGAEVVEDEGVFHIKRLEPDALQMEIYQLQNITLGESSSASGSQSFGTGFANNTNQNGGSQNGSNGYANGSSMMGGMGGSYGGQGGGGYNSGYGGNSSSATGANSGIASLGQFGSSSAMPISSLSKASNILMNLRNLLALQEVNRLETAEKDENGKPALSTRPESKANGESSIRGSIDYNSTNNTVTVVATRQQQQWVRRYLKAVDVPESQIAIDVLFVESDINPSSSFGVNMSGLANNRAISTDALTYGPDNGHSLPAMLSGVTLSTQAVSATVSAWIDAKQARIYQRPTVVTKPDREVVFATTKNIPIIDNAATVGTAGLAANGSSNVPGQGSSTTVQTAFTAATQSIGTITRLRAVPVRKNLISVTITLEISSPDTAGGAAGESLTGRVQTTSTNYTGVFDVEVGKTLAVGGLERVADERNFGKIPGLGSIPLFGFAFKHKTRALSKTHITLFITPRLIEKAFSTEGSAASSNEADHGQLLMSGGLQQAARDAETKLTKENR